MSSVNGNEIKQKNSSEVESFPKEQFSISKNHQTNNDLTIPVSYNLITSVETFRSNMSSSNLNMNLVKNALSTDKNIITEKTIKNSKNSIGITSVIGTDERVAVPDTTVYPYNTICKLEITWADLSTAGGSGFLIDENHVLTAGHCIHDQTTGGWASSINVIPGKAGANEPYGSANAIYLRSFTGWISFQMVEHDFGLITLNRPIGAGMVFMLLSTANPNDPIYINRNLNTAGYPGDRGVPAGEIMFEHSNIGDRADQYNHFYYLDTFEGQSGSPVWREDTKPDIVYSIHTHGNSGIPGNPNYGTRLNENKLYWIETWLKEDSSEDEHDDDGVYEEFNTSKFIISTPGYITIGSVFSISLGCILIEKKIVPKRRRRR